MWRVISSVRLGSIERTLNMKAHLLSCLMALIALSSTSSFASNGGATWSLNDGTTLQLRYRGSVDLLDVTGTQLYTFKEYNNENRIVRQFTQLAEIRGELMAYPYPGSMTYRGTLQVRVRYGEDGARFCDFPLTVNSLYWTTGTPSTWVVDYRLPTPTGYYSSSCKPEGFEDKRTEIVLDSEE
jgi:hypothetical protein